SATATTGASPSPSMRRNITFLSTSEISRRSTPTGRCWRASTWAKGVFVSTSRWPWRTPGSRSLSGAPSICGGAARTSSVDDTRAAARGGGCAAAGSGERPRPAAVGDGEGPRPAAAGEGWQATAAPASKCHVGLDAHGVPGWASCKRNAGPGFELDKGQAALRAGEGPSRASCWRRAKPGFALAKGQAGLRAGEGPSRASCWRNAKPRFVLAKCQAALRGHKRAASAARRRRSAMSRQELVFTVHRQCTAFMDVIRSGRRLLPKVGRSQRFAADDVVYDYGAAPNCLFLVNEGVVRTSVLSSSGKELVTGVWGPGEVFGEFCLCQQQRERNERAVVVEDAELVRLGVEELIQLVSVREGALAMLQLFCHRISALEEKVAELAFANVRTRLGLLLLRLAQDGTPQPDGSVLCQEYPTHEEMARRIGTTREQVSAILAQLRREGAVAYRRTGPMRIFPDRLENRIEAP